MTDVFSTIGIVPYNRKKFERAQDTAYWKRFSGLGGKRGDPNEKEPQKSSSKSKKNDPDDGLQQQYFCSDADMDVYGIKKIT